MFALARLLRTVASAPNAFSDSLIKCYEEHVDDKISKGVENMVEERLRLKKLIEHWAEHNDEHTARLKEAVYNASDAGLPGVARELKEATEERAHQLNF